MLYINSLLILGAGDGVKFLLKTAEEIHQSQEEASLTEVLTPILNELHKHFRSFTLVHGSVSSHICLLEFFTKSPLVAEVGVFLCKKGDNLFLMTYDRLLNFVHAIIFNFRARNVLSIFNFYTTKPFTISFKCINAKPRLLANKS